MKQQRLWSTVAVMSATIMQVLDSTIINVAVPNLAGELNASPDAISWVLTSYLLGSAVFMPLTGFLSDRLGRKRYLVGSIGGFVIASALCGCATTLPEMVLFRVLQGIFGASLAPLSQAIMVETYPPESRGKALAIWGMGVMIAPVVGPSLGGYLTDTLSWRWTFFINIPVGMVSALLALRFVPDSPIRQRQMNWTSYAALAIAIAGVQIVLDRGAEKDWFDSPQILAVSLMAVLAFGVFLWISRNPAAHPVFDLTMLKDRNFVMACLLMLSTGFGIFGSLLLLPLFLENMLGYPTLDAGMHLMPRGIATFFGMSLAGRLSGRVSVRVMLSMGMLLSLFGSVLMTGLTLQMTGDSVLFAMILQGLGMGLVFIPLATLAFSTIPPRLASEAAGVYSLMRSLGSSVGISLASTCLNYNARVNWQELGANITPYNAAVTEYLSPLGGVAQGVGAELLATVVQQQALLQAFVQSFWMGAMSFVLMLPLLLLIRPAMR